MKRTASIPGLIALLGTFGAASGSAQQLVPGTWTGTLVAPGGYRMGLTFEVAQTSDEVSVVMKSVEFEEEMPLQDVQVEEGQMTFWWEPDVRVDCTLLATESGGFEGKCTDGTGPSGEGTLTMVPPGGGA